MELLRKQYHFSKQKDILTVAVRKDTSKKELITTLTHELSNVDLDKVEIVLNAMHNIFIGRRFKFSDDDKTLSPYVVIAYFPMDNPRHNIDYPPVVTVQSVPQIAEYKSDESNIYFSLDHHIELSFLKYI